jgi:hypothetical protein
MGKNKRKWKFYDFDANWEEFIKIWNSDDVQDILERDMNNWCTEELHSRQTYERGDPLWTFSKTDYWFTKLNDAAWEEVHKYNMIETFHKRMKQLYGKNYTDDKDLVFEHFDETWHNAIMEQYAPKPDTLESMIMIMGKNYLSDTFNKVAKIIYNQSDYDSDEEVYGTPTDNIIYTHYGNEDSIILISSEKIVFDLYDYYFSKIDGKSLLQPDKYYNKIHNKWHGYYL